MIIVVFGLPGSGKSYFAEKLAKRIAADYVNSDRLRREMFPARIYSEQEKAAVYNVLLQKMRRALKQNKNVVLDATFHNNETREPFTQAGKKKDRICFIEITAYEGLIRRRLQTERKYSEADFEVYKFIRREWEPMNEPHLMLESNDENIDSMLQKAEAYLQIKDDTRPNK